jgi:very-short-patch-repair endonuclease
MAAVLACGEGSALSHTAAAALLEIGPATAQIHVSVPPSLTPRLPGITVHRRVEFEVTTHHGIPVTTPVCTLVDLATMLDRDQLEQAINDADRLKLANPERLRLELAGMSARPGLAAMRRILDHRTFTLTASVLERRFIPIALRAGLPRPLTRVYVNGFEVDFYWPELGLVVETGGLTYHRTPAQQARDRLRDQTHTAAGLTPLRFTHAQIWYEPTYVQATLESVVRRLRTRPASPDS